MASGWNLWVWLQRIGVVVRRYVYRYPHNNYLFSVVEQAQGVLNHRSYRLQLRSL